ncbi:MAG: hypothetical protein ACI9EF_002378 [Pseudohongiellaceae bacterium]|jgi:hypothetical protein
MADTLLVATRKGLFTVRRQGQQWAVGDDVAFLGDPVSMVMVDPSDGTQYAALDHGHFGVKLHRRNLGGPWEEIAVPVYPEQPTVEASEEEAALEPDVPWSLKLIWSLAAGGADEPDTLWCGTLPGGLFRSDDRGASWSLIESLWNDKRRREWFGGGFDEPGVHSICVDPRDARRVTIGISCGGAWVTCDGGQSWALRASGMQARFLPPDQVADANIQDPHCIVQCRDAPDVLWTQHHSGIWRTTDGCESWQEITAAEPSSFGFPVAVHPGDPQTAWFVPAVQDDQRFPGGGSVVVSRTRDGGQTFEVLRDGLPQHHAYDLVYRHALDVDKTGSTLAFGSTTGSLWVSDDQGDSWATVSQHLPPIYAVRMAD